MRKLILIFCGVFCCLTALHAKDPALYLYQVDALDKVFKDRRYFVDEIDTLAVARGEYATLQVVIKSNREIKGMRAYVESVAGGAGEIEGAQTGWVGYVRAGRKYQPTSKDLLRTPSDYFPDPILTDVEMDMEVNDVQPVWVTVPIARDTEPGLYKGRLVIEGQVDRKKQSWSKDFYVRVFPVTIEETSLLVGSHNLGLLLVRTHFAGDIELSQRNGSGRTVQRLILGTDRRPCSNDGFAQTERSSDISFLACAGDL